MCPSHDPRNATPGITVTGAGCSNTRWVGCRGQPNFFTGSKPQRYQAAADFWFSAGEVRDAHVCNAGIIAGAAPHESAIHASRSNLLLPDDRALALRIDPIDH